MAISVGPNGPNGSPRLSICLDTTPPNQVDDVIANELAAQSVYSVRQTVVQLRGERMVRMGNGSDLLAAALSGVDYTRAGCYIDGPGPELRSRLCGRLPSLLAARSGVVPLPALSANGKVVCTPGALVHHPQHNRHLPPLVAVGPELPEPLPAWAEARAYVRAVLDAVSCSPRDKLLLAALLVLAHIRHLIDGSTPLHSLVGAPGSGKTALARVVAELTGSPVHIPPGSAFEATYNWAMMFQAEYPVLAVDNLTPQALNRTDLKGAITADSTSLISTRQVGQAPRSSRPPSVLLTTGISQDLDDEMRSRVVTVTLTSSMGQSRDETWATSVIRDRPRYLAALATCLGAWWGSRIDPLVQLAEQGRILLPRMREWSALTGSFACWLYPELASAWDPTPEGEAPPYVAVATEDATRRVHAAWEAQPTGRLSRLAPAALLTLVSETADAAELLLPGTTRSPTGYGLLSRAVAGWPIVDGLRVERSTDRAHPGYCLVPTP